MARPTLRWHERREAVVQVRLRHRDYKTLERVADSLGRPVATIAGRVLERVLAELVADAHARHRLFAEP